MPTFCRADKKPASSPAASSGSAYAGAAAAITMPTPSAASSVLITRPFFPSVEKPCQLSCCGQVLARLNNVVPLAQLRIWRDDFGLAAFGQVHRVDAGFLCELFEQTVETVLVDRVVLHAFGLLRDLCDQPLQLLGRLVAFEVLERGEAAANATVGYDGGGSGSDCAAEHSRRGH